jgi:hypothetical protein
LAWESALIAKVLPGSKHGNPPAMPGVYVSIIEAARNKCGAFQNAGNAQYPSAWNGNLRRLRFFHYLISLRVQSPFTFLSPLIISSSWWNAHAAAVGPIQRGTDKVSTQGLSVGFVPAIFYALSCTPAHSRYGLLWLIFFRRRVSCLELLCVHLFVFLNFTTTTTTELLKVFLRTLNPLLWCLC